MDLADFHEPKVPTSKLPLVDAKQASQANAQRPLKAGRAGLRGELTYAALLLASTRSFCEVFIAIVDRRFEYSLAPHFLRSLATSCFSSAIQSHVHVQLELTIP